MSSRVHLAALLVAAVAIVPSAAVAGWGGKGGYEPDTARDATDGYMFPSPDITPCGTSAPYCGVNQVYFNGWEGHRGSFDPNVATARTAFSGQDYTFYALLGVWKDCNADGFIGLGDQGLLEYRSEILASWPGVGASICPATPTPVDHLTGKPPLNWMPSHNDGQWVREFLPFSWLDVNSVTGDLDPYNVNDNGARVWIDYGYPEQVYKPNLDCWLGTYPRGTFHSTGAMLETFDCNDGNRVTDTFDLVADSNPLLQPYSFSDHPRDQHNSASQLNQRNPWGVPSDRSYVSAWDCSQPQPVQVIVPAVPQVNSAQQDVVNVSAPRVPPGVDAGGSPSGTLNVTESGFDRCTPRTDQGAPAGADAPYALEGNVLQQAAKVQTTGVMVPNQDTRPAAPFAAVLGQGTPDPSGTDAGSGLMTASGFWSDQLAGHLFEGPLTDSNTGYVSAVQPVTYYAYVDPAAVAAYGLSLPAPTPGTYGAPTCGSFTTGVHNDWDCNPAEWWRDVDGNDISFRDAALGRDPSAPASAPCTPGASLTGSSSRGCMPISVTPGAPFNLRDIDCYDQSAEPLRQNGVQYGVFTGTACDEATS